MKLAYDAGVDALDIHISDGIVARTIEIDSGTLVDVDVHGAVLSIEVIRLDRPWPVEAILDQFEISDPDAAVLKALREERALEFAEPAPLVIA